MARSDFSGGKTPINCFLIECKCARPASDFIYVMRGVLMDSVIAELCEATSINVYRLRKLNDFPVNKLSI